MPVPIQEPAPVFKLVTVLSTVVVHEKIQAFFTGPGSTKGRRVVCKELLSLGLFTENYISRSPTIRRLTFFDEPHQSEKQRLSFNSSALKGD